MADEEVTQREFRLCQYLDGQMGRRERRQFEQELQADPTLREELELYASLEGMLGGLAQEEPEGVEINYDQQRAQIVAAAEKRALLAPARHAPFFLRPTFAVFAAAAVVLLLVAARVLLTPPTITPPAQAPSVAVSMRVLSPEPSHTGQGLVSVQFQPLGQEEMPQEPQAPSLPSTPSGTVVVSVGASPVAPVSESASSEVEFVY